MTSELAFFHLTGARAGDLVAPGKLRPALFARVTDIDALRYDFPLVALGDDELFAPLSQLMDQALAQAAPTGIAGERTRRAGLRIEREIRRMLAAGESADLAAIWPKAVERLAVRGGDAFVADTSAVRAAITVTGALIPCGPEVGSLVTSHVWRIAQARKARAMRSGIDAQAQRLTDLVRGDLARSIGGRTPDRLRASVSEAYAAVFDFERMSELLTAPSGAQAMSAKRRERIERTVKALRAQRFFEADLPYVFAFGQIEDALSAYQDRQGSMAALVRAMAVAELELRGAYDEARHDEYFADFDERSLTAEERALFPDYLVRPDAGSVDATGRARIMEGLTSGAPLKIVFVTDDAFGLGAHLATTAMGLGEVFVIQASAARLFRVRDRVRAAIEYRGPALLSIYAPTAETSGPLPAYLVAAAATDSRAFPTFSYDPSAGPGWKECFALHDDGAAVWPEEDLDYAGTDLRRVRERVAFTPADLAICDARRADDFAVVPRPLWSDAFVPVREAAVTTDIRVDRVPFVWAVDADNGLHRLAVAERLVQMVRRSAEAWRRLRELDDLKREPIAPVNADVPSAAVMPAAVAPADAVEAVADVPASDEPYIETPRCTTCNECTNLNPRAFAYNDNKQAYLKDAKAASYRELVEAAENCQVAIIHPGKPSDPNEPGIDDLMKRAGSFR